MSVVVPVLVPFTRTLTPGRVSPEASVSLPLTSFGGTSLNIGISAFGVKSSFFDRIIVLSTIE